MIKEVWNHDGTINLREEEADPTCGIEGCEYCCRCLHCFGNQPCPSPFSPDGKHHWIEWDQAEPSAGP